MSRILEYAQGAGSERGRRVLRWMVSVCVLVPAILVMLGLGLFTCMDWQRTRVTPEKAKWMWTFLYCGQAFVMERRDGRTVFEMGILGTTYHVVGDRAAEAEADAAARDWVMVLVKFMKTGETGSPGLSTQIADELKVLTGQDLGDDAAAWKSWTDGHLPEVKGEWETYERLATLRREASEKSGEPWGFGHREAAIRAQYEHRMSRFWSANWWRIGLICLLAAGCVRIIWWARRPRSAVIRAGGL